MKLMYVNTPTMQYRMQSFQSPCSCNSVK